MKTTCEACSIQAHKCLLGSTCGRSLTDSTSIFCVPPIVHLLSYSSWLSWRKNPHAPDLPHRSHPLFLHRNLRAHSAVAPMTGTVEPPAVGTLRRSGERIHATRPPAAPTRVTATPPAAAPTRPTCQGCHRRRGSTSMCGSGYGGRGWPRLPRLPTAKHAKRLRLGPTKRRNKRRTGAHRRGILQSELDWWNRDGY